MRISNSMSPSFGRIYIKEDRLSREQFIDSIYLAQDLTLSRTYIDAHKKGIDLYITTDDDNETKVLYISDDNGKYYTRNGMKPIESYPNVSDVENDLNDIMASNYQTKRRYPASSYYAIAPAQGWYYNAEPSDYDAEHIWLA